MPRGPLSRAGRAAVSVTIPVALAVSCLATLHLARLNAFYRLADSWLLWGYLAVALGLACLPLALAAAALAELAALVRGRPALVRHDAAAALGLLTALGVVFAVRCAEEGYAGMARLAAIGGGAWLLAAALSAAALGGLAGRPRLRSAVGLVLGGLVLGGFVAGTPRTSTPTAASGPPPVVTAPARRLLLVGFDGLDPTILDRMMSNGDLPTFRRLADEGYLARAKTLPQTLSPIIWTTIATGKPPREHGVLGFLAYRLAGMECALQSFAERDGCGTGLMTTALDVGRRLGLVTRWPVTSHLRRVRSLWDILSERGLKVVVVNWWASWPADPVAGQLVSDRFHHSAMQDRGRLEPTSRLTYPADLVTALAPLVVPPASVPREQLVTLFEPGAETKRGNAQQVMTHESLSDWSQGRDSMVEAFLSSDLTYVNVAGRLLAEPGWSFAAVYLRGIDVASHVTGAFSRLVARPGQHEKAVRYSGTLEAYYRLADRQLAVLLADVGDDTDVLVCSDHGFTWEPHHGFNHVETAPDGVFLLHGPDAARGRGQARVEDIPPTVLRLLDQPVPDDMTGRVLSDAFAAGSPARAPGATLATYETGPRFARRAADAAEQQDDEKIHEELRALGYVK